MENKKLGEELLEESKEKEETLLSHQKSRESYLFLDIETGKGHNEIVRSIRLDKIKKEIEKEQYQWRSDWKEDTNERKAEEFELSKPKKIINALESVDNDDPMSPFFNRIVIAGTEGMLSDGRSKIVQQDETNTSEKEMINSISNGIKKFKSTTFVTFSEFDIHTIRLKAIKYGIPFNPKYIDIAKYASYWPMVGRKEVISQDMLAAILDVKPNKYDGQVYPEEIGELFDNIKSAGLTDEWKEKLELYLKYNAEDVRVLKEIFFKLKQANIIW